MQNLLEILWMGSYSRIESDFDHLTRSYDEVSINISIGAKVSADVSRREERQYDHNASDYGHTDGRRCVTQTVNTFFWHSLTSRPERGVWRAASGERRVVKLLPLRTEYDAPPLAYGI